MVRGIIGIDADRQHYHSFVFQVRLHLDHGRRLFDTGRAPRRPKIQHHHLTAKLIERDGVIGILHAELRSARANTKWMRTAVTSDEGSQQSNTESQMKGSSGHTAIITKSGQMVNGGSMQDVPNPATAGRLRRDDEGAPEVSIVIPARNEETNIGACLQSLLVQEGLAFETIVVDDSSTDRTPEIARGFENARVISAQNIREASPEKRPTGKNNALIAGASVARGKWLLFTDADTVHRPGSLVRALDEAEREAADLLSYSPEQEVITFTERAVMPVVFAELAAEYPLHKIRQQRSEVAAANGQYILVRRSAYDAVGGHAAVASEILEDVALAKRFRNTGFRVYFRYGGDAVRTRMYRNWSQLREGWTKNLALLFPHANRLALQSVVIWGGAWASLAIAATASSKNPLRIVFVSFFLLAYRRIQRSHFSRANSLLALAFGFPIFSYLLWRSSRAHQSGEIVWKGRSYSVGGKGRPCIKAETTEFARLSPKKS
jgi:glycosyltransferase involved in cell wall biosynthesis